MRKTWMLLVGVSLLVGGCSNHSSWDGYNSSETEKLQAAGISQKDAETCKNPNSLIQMTKGKIKKDYLESYCAQDLRKASPENVNAILEAGGTPKQAKTFGSISYAWPENASRYLAYKDGKDASDTIIKVNLNLDKPYYTDIKTIENTDDLLMLVTKYQKLPDHYRPSNLVETPNACTSEYSCFPDQQYIVKKAGDHFSQLVTAAAKEDITITAIASLRDYEYQKMLYNYYASTNGSEYADTYFARPGQSEHNTGLAVDITLDGMDYTEIENSPHYAWLIDHMADYGFILRYPKDKEDITGFGYESWHLRYVGKKAAQEIMEKGITLDEYHAMKVKVKS